jgi:AbrB family looped-hinge helix DNA binding protein
MDQHVPGTKLAERLFARPGGATMAEVRTATGGPQYNVLSNLAARGYTIRKVKEGRGTRYFAQAPDSQFVEATITSKGQVTIPKEIRERLRLRSGHKVRFAVEDDDRALMIAVPHRLSELVGILPRPKRTASLEEMDEAIRGAAVARFLRAVGGKKR